MFDYGTFDWLTFDQGPFEAPVIVEVQGGGTSKKLIEDEAIQRDPRWKTGLIKLKRRPDPPKITVQPLPVPTFAPEPTAPKVEEKRFQPISVPAEDVATFASLARTMADALDQSDIERLLTMSEEDERDLADIEAMLEFLD